METRTYNCVRHMNLDLAPRENQSSAPNENSLIEEKIKYEKWTKANRSSLMIIKRSISDAIYGWIPEIVVKDS